MVSGEDPDVISNQFNDNKIDSIIDNESDQSYSPNKTSEIV